MRIELNEIHFWHWQYRTSSIEFHSLAKKLISPDELGRLFEFRWVSDQDEYLASRFLVRTVLSRYLPRVSARELKFQKTLYGKPELTQEQNTEGISFNLSHSGGLIVLVVSRCKELGVDVEGVDRNFDYLSFAKQVFTNKEYEQLAALKDAPRRDLFWQYWTLKESYVKATGFGLSQALNHFSFLLDGERARIVFEDSLSKDCLEWHFRLVTVSDRHQVAIASKGIDLHTITAINVETQIDLTDCVSCSQ